MLGTEEVCAPWRKWVPQLCMPLLTAPQPAQPLPYTLYWLVPDPLSVFEPFHVVSLRPARCPRVPRSPRPHRRRRRRRRRNAGCQPLPGPEVPVHRTAKPSWTSSAGRMQPWLGWAFSGNHGGSAGGLRGGGNSRGRGGRADAGAGAPPRGAPPQSPTSLAWASPSLPSQGSLGPHGPVPEH